MYQVNLTRSTLEKSSSISVGKYTSISIPGIVYHKATVLMLTYSLRRCRSHTSRFGLGEAPALRPWFLPEFRSGLAFLLPYCSGDIASAKLTWRILISDHNRKPSAHSLGKAVMHPSSLHGHFQLQEKRFWIDPAAYRDEHIESGGQSSPSVEPIPGHDFSSTHVVPLPCKRREQHQSKPSASEAVGRHRPLPE